LVIQIFEFGLHVVSIYKRRSNIFSGLKQRCKKPRTACSREIFPALSLFFVSFTIFSPQEASTDDKRVVDLDRDTPAIPVPNQTA
jgi:hypothetical protein